MLDPKARDAAIEAANEIAIDGAPVPDFVDAILHAYLSVSLPADTAELVERLRSHLEEHNSGGGRWHETPEVCLQAASLIQSQAARERALMDALEHVTELLVDTWHVVMPLDNDPKQEIAVLRARTLLNRRAEG